VVLGGLSEQRALEVHGADLASRSVIEAKRTWHLDTTQGGNQFVRGVVGVWSGCPNEDAIWRQPRETYRRGRR
jgi:hypothetical protein